MAKIPKIRVNTPVPFPTLVQGSGPVTLTKKNGVWTAGLSYTVVAEIVPPPDDLTTDLVLVWDSTTQSFFTTPISAFTTTGAIDFASPPPIGATTPNTGAFTTLTVGGQPLGTFAFKNYATPPPIGATTPNAGAFSTLNTTGPATFGSKALFAHPADAVSFFGFADPTWFGADPTGATDSTAAFNNAVSALSGGGILRLPPGTFLLSSAINITAGGVTVQGSGGYATIIVLNAATQNGFTFSAGATFSGISNLSIRAGVTKTAGAGIVFSGTEQFAYAVQIENQYVGISMVNTTLTLVEDCKVDFSVLNGIGVTGTATTGPILENNIVTHSGGHGVFLMNCGGAYLVDNTIIQNQIGLLIASDASNATIPKSSSFFFSSGNGYDSNTSDNWVVLTGGGTPITNIVSDNDEFGTSSSGMGININGNAGAVSGCSFTNPQIINNSQFGALVQGTWDHVEFIAPQCAGNSVTAHATYPGITFQNNGAHCKVIGGWCGPQGVFGDWQVYGVLINPGVDYAYISGVDCTGNPGGGVQNNSTATHNVIIDNINHNPVGVSGPITVGASPATIRNGPSPATYYFTQSATNTAFVTQGGVSLGSMTSPYLPMVVHLGPNDTIVVTWGATAPTYVMSVH